MKTFIRMPVSRVPVAVMWTSVIGRVLVISVINLIEMVNSELFSTIPLGYGILRFRINIWHFIKAFR